MFNLTRSSINVDCLPAMCTGPRGLTRLSVVWNIQTQTTPDSHVLRSYIQIRPIHADVNDHLSGAVNCYLEKAPRFYLRASNSIQNYKNTKGSSFTRVKHKFSVDSETQKSFFWVFLWSKSNHWPWTPFTVMSEDTVQNCLIYARNVSCLFWCPSFSVEAMTVAAEFGVNLPGDYLRNINSD